MRVGSRTNALNRPAVAGLPLARPDADRLATTLAELTIGNLIDDYMKAVARTSGRGKLGCLQILKREIGSVPVTALSALTLREFTDRRLVQGAGGHTIGKDLSAFSAFLKWARGAKGLPVPKGLVIDARRGLECRGLSTVSKWRGREPTDAEMERLYAHWLAKPRQRIDMVMLCKFALATGMGQEAICELRVEDVNTETHTIIVSRGADAGGSAQVVPLLTNAWALLQPLLEGRKGGTVFGAYAPSVSVAFTRACHALAIHDLRFQDLRHRATAELFRMGLDVDKIAELTGRKTTSRLHRHKPADV